jgi:hypothetical protein
MRKSITLCLKNAEVNVRIGHIKNSFSKGVFMHRTVRWILIGAAFMMIGAWLAPAQDPAPEQAQKVMDAAYAKAKAENKAVFVHFSASW